jgi:hypothetical protein
MNNLNAFIQQNIYPVLKANFCFETQKNESSFQEISKKSDFRVTKYGHAKDIIVQNTVSVDEILKTIKNGNEYLPLIEEARKIGKGNAEYDIIKTEKLPTFRFNFLFKDSVSNKNIIAPTGLIYLDADNIDWIPFNKYVYASWKSLSNSGYSILVKVDGLTQDNFKEVYEELSSIIGIKTDIGARKPVQQTVLSYDSNLYNNPYSLTYIYSKKEKVSSSTTKEKKEVGIGVCDTLHRKKKSGTIRFNNINDYFPDDIHKYIVFKDKEMICNPFIPRTIKEGSRNSILFFLLSQYALLNPNQGETFLLSIGRTILRKMHPPLREQELKSTVRKILQGREDKTLTLHYNEARRVLFNPKLKLSHKEIMQIVNRELGNIKKELTRAIIYDALESWDSEIDGKLIQVSLAIKTRLSLTTIKRYWKEYKWLIDDLKA